MSSIAVNWWLQLGQDERGAMIEFLEGTLKPTTLKKEPKIKPKIKIINFKVNTTNHLISFTFHILNIFFINQGFI